MSATHTTTHTTHGAHCPECHAVKFHFVIHSEGGARCTERHAKLTLTDTPARRHSDAKADWAEISLHIAAFPEPPARMSDGNRKRDAGTSVSMEAQMAANPHPLKRR